MVCSVSHKDIELLISWSNKWCLEKGVLVGMEVSLFFIFSKTTTLIFLIPYVTCRKRRRPWVIFTPHVLFTVANFVRL